MNQLALSLVVADQANRMNLIPLFLFSGAVAIIALTLLWTETVRRGIERGRQKAARQAGALREREARAALCVDDDDPLWCAVHQMLDIQIARATEKACDSETQLLPPLPAYYGGAARHLEIFRDFLITEREQAMKEAYEED